MSNIEWTDRTWNPVAGCKKVSHGCKNCYAETMAKRLAAMGQKTYQQVVNEHGWNGKFIELPARLAEPLKWRKPCMVFVNSMSDLFGEGVSFEYIAAIFGVMAACPQHTFQVLTKRPERAVEFFRWAANEDSVGGGINCAITEMFGHREPNTYLTKDGMADEASDELISDPPDWPLHNVWLGCSAEDQPTANHRIPLILQCPAFIRFISLEPLLGPVDVDSHLGNEVIAYGQAGRRGITDFEVKPPRLHWVIVGGESGPGARPCDVAWIRSIVAQCKAAGVPCFVKQLGANPDNSAQPDGSLIQAYIKDRKGGAPEEWPADLRVREFPAQAVTRA